MPDEMQNAISIAVVDDHPLMREGIVNTLIREPGFEIVGQGQSADDAIFIAEQKLPDVMLIDINMPGGGLTALQKIATSCPAVATIVITVREDEDTVAQALRLGARAYVLKGISGIELVRTVRAVKAGECYITPELATRLLCIDREAATREKQPTPTVLGLTTREDQILQRIAQGMSNKEIGRDLELAEKTVKHYVTNILQKLQVRNRVEAALLAQSSGGSDRPAFRTVN